MCGRPPPDRSSSPPPQLLLVLLLAMPEALSGAALVDVPVLQALLSLPFYLLCLLLASVHVLVCTSAGSACYLCSLSWGLVFTAVAFASATFCVLVSMATRRLPSWRTTSKVSLTRVELPWEAAMCVMEWGEVR